MSDLSQRRTKKVVLHDSSTLVQIFVWNFEIKRWWLDANHLTRYFWYLSKFCQITLHILHTTIMCSIKHRITWTRNGRNVFFILLFSSVCAAFSRLIFKNIKVPQQELTAALKIHSTTSLATFKTYNNEFELINASFKDLKRVH